MSMIKKTTLQSAALTLFISWSGSGYSQQANQIITYPDGSQYTGELINGKPGGQGRIQWANGDSYEGQWRNEQPHGRGKKTFLDGSIYEGEFANGQQDGKGQLTYPDGTVYSGDWQSGAPNGQGKFAFKEAGTYEGAVYLGLPHGQGTFLYANGNIYDGQWEHGKRSGMGKLRYHNGDIYIGRFEQGHPQGTGSITYANGFRFKGNFTNGKPDGDGTCYKPDEQALCSFVNGEQIAYAVIPQYIAEEAPPAVNTAAAAPLTAAVTTADAKTDNESNQPAHEAETLKATAKKAFVAALTDEKEKLKPSYSAGDLNPQRSDILFSHNFESLDLNRVLRTGWWETNNSLFSNQLLVHTRSGDLEIELKIKRFKGPGTYRIKPGQVQAWFKGKLLQGLRDFANTVTIRNVNDAWIEGNLNLSFQQKDTYGDYYKVENGVFRLNNEPLFNPHL